MLSFFVAQTSSCFLLCCKEQSRHYEARLAEALKAPLDFLPYFYVAHLPRRRTIKSLVASVVLQWLGKHFWTSRHNRLTLRPGWGHSFRFDSGLVSFTQAKEQELAKQLEDRYQNGSCTVPRVCHVCHRRQPTWLTQAAAGTQVRKQCFASGFAGLESVDIVPACPFACVA